MVIRMKALMFKNCIKGILLCLISLLFSDLISQEVSTYAPHRPRKVEVYLSYHEFLTGEITVKDSFNIHYFIRDTKNWNGSRSYYPVCEYDCGKIKRLWGFCDGQDYFIYFHIWDEFFKLDTNGEYLTFMGYGVIGKTGAFAGYWAGDAIGGSLGGALGGTAGRAIERADAKKRIHKYYLGPNTGWIYVDPFKLEKREAQYQYSKLIFFRGDKDEHVRSIDFMVDDSLHFSFPRNSHVELSYPTRAGPIDYCYGKDYETCQKIHLNPFEKNYIRVIHAIGSGGIRFVQLNESDTDYSAYRAYQKQKKREKKAGKK